MAVATVAEFIGLLEQLPLLEPTHREHLAALQQQFFPISQPWGWRTVLLHPHTILKDDWPSR
jgi:hypothetical protein